MKLQDEERYFELYTLSDWITKLQPEFSAVWAELFAPDLDIDGYLDVLATVRGTTEDPVLNGQGEVRQGRLIVPDFPQVDAIRGLVFFNRDSIELDGLTARMGGGNLRGCGHAVF